MKVASLNCASGAKSAIADCLVIIVAVTISTLAFSVWTPLIERQKEHPACKK